MSGLLPRILAGLAAYLVFLFVLSMLVALFVRYQTRWKGSGLYGRIWRWFGRWHALVAAITVVGGVLGTVLYPVVGSLLRMDLPMREMALNGLKDGSFYAFIWAPGISFVACLVMGKREKAGKVDTAR